MTATRRPVVIGIAVAIALVVIAVLAGQGESGEGAPLSPTSASPDGLKGLVLLMESFGADVRTDETVPDPDTRLALLARDGLDDRDRDDLRAWVRGGGTLVVADPDSALAGPPSGDVGGIALVRGHCDLTGIDDVNRIEIGGLDSGNLSVLGGKRYQVDGQPSCFGDGDAAYVLERRLGSGVVISVGGPNLFANTFLDKSDNSVLAIRLLQPNARQPVAILASSAPGSGRTTLLDLVPDRVFQAFIQVGIAFLLYALWRARRLGRPVVEPQPVAIPGSQLVRAVGSLEQRTHATDRAAGALRHDVERLARERYGLASDASRATVAQVVADRTALDRQRVEAALGDAPVVDDNALLALTYELDAIRKEILHGR
jgi:Domain of unknown function (DUF4350)